MINSMDLSYLLFSLLLRIPVNPRAQGIIVNDLPAATAFFLDLGLEMLGEGKVGGEWVERINRA